MDLVNKIIYDEKTLYSGQLILDDQFYIRKRITDIVGGVKKVKRKRTRENKYDSSQKMYGSY